MYKQKIRPKLKKLYWFGKQRYFNVVDAFISSSPAVADIGCGRSGTNMVLEILSGHSALCPTSPDPEDKRFFVKGRRFPPGYLSKCDTDYGSTESLIALLRLNSRLKIVWTIRDPRDICLSKLRRGVPESEGGDWINRSEDSTDRGCIKSITKMFEMYQCVSSKFSGRIYLVRMEDVINDVPGESKRLAGFLNIEYQPAMVHFPQRMRNEKKRARYGNEVDKGQVGLWHDTETVYDGFFAGQAERLGPMFDRLDSVIHYFGYK